MHAPQALSQGAGQEIAINRKQVLKVVRPTTVDPPARLNAVTEVPRRFDATPKLEVPKPPLA